MGILRNPSSYRKLVIFEKDNILDEIFIFVTSNPPSEDFIGSIAMENFVNWCESENIDLYYSSIEFRIESLTK